ncbi:MAG: hypothetical protein Q9M19_04850 [Mariprofundaceae bacterium]|nr:hypothetical protein [Mariprofundaceae bacterium]
MKLSLRDLKAVADEIIGQPFCIGGRGTPEHPGFDCLGVVLYVYKRMGIDISFLDPHIFDGLYTDDDRWNVAQSLVESVAREHGLSVSVLSPDAPVTHFDTVGWIDRRLTHAALVLPGDKLLHASAGMNGVGPNKVILSSLNRYNSRKSFGVRFEGIEWVP